MLIFVFKYRGLFVRSLGWFENDDSIFIAMEHIEHGDLQSKLTGPLPEAEVRQISIQILRGLQHLHNNRFIHRDLKPEVTTGPNWWIKIGDFGFSKRFDETNITATQVGTPRFIAPEVLQLYPPELNGQNINHRSTYSVDIWSLGVMSFFMLTHFYPFPKLQDLLSYVQTSDFPESSSLSSISREAYSFLKGLLVADPSKRMSAEEAFESPWLKEDPLAFPSSIEQRMISGLSETSNSTEASKSWNALSESSDVTISELNLPNLQLSIPIEGDQSRTPINNNASLDWFARGESFYRTGHYVEAETSFRVSFEGKKVTHGIDHAETLCCFYWIGRVIYVQEKYSEAEGVFRQVYERKKETLGADHADTLDSLHWTGLTLHGQQKYDEAEATFQRAAERRKETLGPYHADTLHSIHWIGRVLYDMKGLSEAEAAFRQAYERRKKTLGAYHADTLYSLHWIGLALHGQIKYYKAEDTFRQAYEGKIKTLGADHVDTLHSLHWTGIVLFDLQKYDEAEETFQLVVERRMKTLGADHPNTLNSLQYLGLALFSQENYVEAEGTIREAFTRRKNTLGLDHADTLFSLCWIGLALHRQEKYSEAEAAFQEVFERRKMILGINHADTLESLQRPFNFGRLIPGSELSSSLSSKPCFAS
ncbi:hypothetical protein N7495_008840 [Penicillium taxi]|uniref:uncharacterized protein n=1 Tax=Penicillium taxi TaxID=168475 RepID=UPI002545BAC9|nr:uncharacterized protein N7495_008840 [Penicillium taxi]KAJ5888799.1 hypothetical protein N7495_008840 [Penicillium taxi]